MLKSPKERIDNIGGGGGGKKKRKSKKKWVINVFFI